MHLPEIAAILALVALIRIWRHTSRIEKLLEELVEDRGWRASDDVERF